LGEMYITTCMYTHSSTYIK